MIKITGLKKSFGTKVITNGLDLSVGDGEFLAIIGRSGEGKSVLLKQLIGLIEPDA
jgi:phospholipid/cholesterol/gamma-HCH transport system ATP-binding protein